MDIRPHHRALAIYISTYDFQFYEIEMKLGRVEKVCSIAQGFPDDPYRPMWTHILHSWMDPQNLMTTFDPSPDFADDGNLAPLPKASFAYDDLRARIGAVTAQFDAFIVQGRDDVLEKRQKWLAGVAEDRETYTRLQQEFEFYTNQEAVLSRTMEKERQEVTEVSGAIDEFSRQKLAMEERRNALQAQVDALRAELRRKREAKQAARRTLEAQRSKNEPELRFFEDKLAMQIAGFREDALSFVFTHIDDKDYDRKFAFTIDVSEREYKVIECTPPVANLGELLDTLNRTRSFYAFLKYMRKAFKDQYQASKCG